ncbi:hypothetical protein AB1A81_10985 [Bdellovibrio bacteriovorus]|uniref:Uncharacterized protein n=1 Tax=Bdellovibrio bacteriovorus (strain ATCC 15356 / DSM 50701 / NCIMB 9529 / HD100) TaxID=264462 RepID=Q6MKJ5_BDEBA|nr:hypothetical protein [Bdellovibrio bacteriovorus]AHZ84920.1 hypothetical protein EP01_08215 [Bdellovibrio bacteriovorus]BEV68807.1 hypothetical protein Bb109J_c2227 [Bdellovibrio bacteriovorus]CAE80212.1 hypothetical protein predicted by Glimmer/Critica [Bdellovibrio bacteriovorus HD100]
MKSKAITSTLFGILSLQSLLAPAAQASGLNQLNQDGLRQETETRQNPALAERIIQKRIVGFDPKQAVDTLTYLYQSGVEQFENDGSVIVTLEMVPEIMQTAAVDGIEVRILQAQGAEARIKFAAHDENKFDRSRIEEAKELANTYQLKCDMDGKVMM